MEVARWQGKPRLGIDPLLRVAWSGVMARTAEACRDDVVEKMNRGVFGGVRACTTRLVPMNASTAPDGAAQPEQALDDGVAPERVWALLCEETERSDAERWIFRSDPRR